MKYDVIAYCWNDALAGFTREDAQRLTHVNLAFGLIEDGLLDLHLLKYLHLLPKLREWNPEMKIVLSVGGWGADGFSHMAMTEEGRRNFAKSCLDAVEKYNLDGIDIDWEYPCNDAAGIGADPRDKENFTALLATLREYLGKDRIVSIAVGASQRCIADAQMDKVAEIVDYVQLMTYDMVDGTRAGHHAALGATKGDKSGLNTRDTVEAYRRAEAMERNALVRAQRLKEKLSQLCQSAHTRYTDSGEELQALTQDLSSVLSRMQDTIADLQVAFDETEEAFEDIQTLSYESVQPC